PDVFAEPASRPLPRFQEAVAEWSDAEVSRPSRRSFQLLPWVGGVLIMLLLVGSASYWLIDRFSSKAAIAEVDRLSGRKTWPFSRPTHQAAKPTIPVTAANAPVRPPIRERGVPVKRSSRRTLKMP